MNDNQRNTSDMFKLVKGFCVDHSELTSKWPDFQPVFTEFTGYISDIDDIGAKQLVDLTSETKAKTVMRKALTDTMFGMSVQCAPYAKVREDEVLFSKVYLKKKGLYNLPDAELVTTANNFFAVVTDLLPNLTGYDITSEQVKDGKKLASDYSEKYQKPKDAKAQVSSYTEQLNLIIAKAKKALTKIDFIVKAGLAKEPALLAEYLLKRIVPKLGHGKRALDCWFIDASTGVALAGFELKIHLLNQPQLKKNIKKTGKKGRCYFNSLPEGEYVFEVSHLGYVTATGTFYITTGEMTKLVVKVSKK